MDPRPSSHPGCSSPPKRRGRHSSGFADRPQVGTGGRWGAALHGRSPRVTPTRRPQTQGRLHSRPTNALTAAAELVALARPAARAAGRCPSARRPTAPGPGSNESSPGRPIVAPRARAATSPRPECRATNGSAPAAAPSAATMPNASSRIDGTTCTSIAASASGAYRWSSRPVNVTSRSPPAAPATSGSSTACDRTSRSHRAPRRRRRSSAIASAASHSRWEPNPTTSALRSRGATLGAPRASARRPSAGSACRGSRRSARSTPASRRSRRAASGSGTAWS